MGGAAAAPLWVYLAFIPASLAWTLSQQDTLFAIGEAWKMAVIYAAVQNVVDSRARLRRFLLVAALASLGPALGSIEVWRTGDALVDGFRSHWRGAYGDPNRLAMALVAVLPFALYGAVTARRRRFRIFFAGVAAAQLAAIVLTHSRSGSIAAGLAVLLFMARGRGGAARGAVAALSLALGLGAFVLFCAFCGWLLLRLWSVGADPLVGVEARAVFAALAGYLVTEMANGYSLSWFLYFLFACAAALVRIARARAALAREAT